MNNKTTSIHRIPNKQWDNYKQSINKNRTTALEQTAALVTGGRGA